MTLHEQIEREYRDPEPGFRVHHFMLIVIALSVITLAMHWSGLVDNVIHALDVWAG